MMQRPRGSLALAYLAGHLTLAGWSCTAVSDEARQQAIADVNLGRGLYADERDMRGAIVAWERAIRRDPENAEARLYLGQVMGSLERWPDAERHLREAVRLYAQRAAVEETIRAPLAEARNSLGAVLVNAGRPGEAIPVLRAVTEELTYRSPHLAWGNLGQALLRANQIPEAVTVLERAVALQPNFCVGWARLGEAQLRADNLPQALASLDRAASVEATGCSAIQAVYLHRAKVRVRMRQPEEARADLARCIELAADTAEGRECAALGRSVAP